MLWDKLCWLLALLALSSGGLPPPSDPLSTPRIFLSFKGKQSKTTSQLTTHVATLAPLHFLFLQRNGVVWLPGWCEIQTESRKSNCRSMEETVRKSRELCGFGASCKTLNSQLARKRTCDEVVQTIANCASPDRRRRG